MYLSHEAFVNKLIPQEVEDLLRKGTSVRPNDILQKVVTRLQPPVKNILEIGTWRGLSSLVMASCDNVEHVYTFDIRPFPTNEFYWEKFNVKDKITHFVLSTSEEIYDVIKNLGIKFDFAFIDGSHETDAETKDFMFVKTICPRIIADDTDDSRVFGIFEPYGAKRISFRFAVWMADGDYSIVDEIKKDLTWDEPYGKLDFRHLEGK